MRRGQRVSRLLSWSADAQVLWDVGLLTLWSTRMIWSEFGQVPDITVDDYPAVFWSVVFGDLLD